LKTPGPAFSLEIGLVRVRDIRVLLVIVFVNVFRTDDFPPIVEARPVSDGRGPRHSEDAFILDRDVDLQMLAPVGGVSAFLVKAEAVIREHGVNFFLFSLLYRARLDPDLSQRRENVLAGRFPMKFGGHLAGYMALKNIWRTAKEKSGRAHDPELFGSPLRVAAALNRRPRPSRNTTPNATTIGNDEKT
jgi:hypothetical protein